MNFFSNINDYMLERIEYSNSLSNEELAENLMAGAWKMLDFLIIFVVFWSIVGIFLSDSVKEYIKVFAPMWAVVIGLFLLMGVAC